MKKHKAKIKNWKLMQLGNYVLVGKVFDHPMQVNFGPDEYHWTKEVIKVDFKNKTAETIDTIFELV